MEGEGGRVRYQETWWREGEGGRDGGREGEEGRVRYQETFVVGDDDGHSLELLPHPRLRHIASHRITSHHQQPT